MILRAEFHRQGCMSGSWRHQQSFQARIWPDGGGSSPGMCTPQSRQCHTALLNVACHGVELHTRRVLDAGNMLHLLRPDHLHLLLQYRDAWGYQLPCKRREVPPLWRPRSPLYPWFSSYSAWQSPPYSLPSGLLLVVDLEIFLVLSIFKMTPWLEVAMARCTSRTYTARNHLEVGNGSILVTMVM